MEPVEEEDLTVELDIRHLTRTLTSEDLDPSVMFSRQRSIRSCRRMANLISTGSYIERLSRVPLPE